MVKIFQTYLIEITIFLMLAIVAFITFSSLVIADNGLFISQRVLLLNTIFISILLEALPFVIIGVLLAGTIQVFVKESTIQNMIPKNRVFAVIGSCIVGSLFPACECGIVPIVRRLVAKGLPIFAGIGFMLTGPLINPIVTASTYMAFGHDFRMAVLRITLGFFIALIIGIIISLLFRQSQLKINNVQQEIEGNKPQNIMIRLKQMLLHAIDEFFYISKFLIIGALLAAFVQTYIPTKDLFEVGESFATSLSIMMGLAYLLSLCSEADAFIAASFSHLFPTAALLGFLIYGPMLDLKNTIMLFATFKARFVMILMLIITLTVFVSLMIIQLWI